MCVYSYILSVTYKIVPTPFFITLWNNVIGYKEVKEHDQKI